MVDGDLNINKPRAVKLSTRGSYFDSLALVGSVESIDKGGESLLSLYLLPTLEGAVNILICHLTRSQSVTAIIKSKGVPTPRVRDSVNVFISLFPGRKG